MIKKFAIAFCVITAISVSAFAQQPQPTMNATVSRSISTTVGGQDKKSLYTRLGGYDAIALVVDDFITRLATDKRFERFFAGFSDDVSQKKDIVEK